MGQEPSATREAKRNSEAEEGRFSSRVFGTGFLMSCVSLTDIVQSCCCRTDAMVASIISAGTRWICNDYLNFLREAWSGHCRMQPRGTCDISSRSQNDLTRARAPQTGRGTLA